MKLKIMMIKWDDACSNEGHFTKDGEPADCVVLQTVGYLVKNSKKSMCLAKEIGLDGSYTHVTSIPKSLIRKKRILR